MPQESGSEKSWELTGMQEYAWDGGVPVYSLGWSQEEGKLFVHTAVQEGEQAFLRKIDMQYGFYEDAAQFPAEGLAGAWISPDGSAAVLLQEGSEGMRLTIWDSQLHKTQEAELFQFWPDGILGQWSADSSSFWLWDRFGTPGTPTFCLQREEGWRLEAYEDGMDYGYAEQGAVTADGSRLIKMYRGKTWKDGDVAFLLVLEQTNTCVYSMGDLQGMDGGILGEDAYLALSLRIWSAREQMAYGGWYESVEAGDAPRQEQGTDAAASAYEGEMDGEEKEAYTNLEGIKAFAVDSRQSRAVIAEQQSDGYAVYLCGLTGEGTLTDRQLLCRGQDPVEALYFSADGQYVLVAEDREALWNEEMGMAYEGEGTRNWRVVILQL